MILKPAVTIQLHVQDKDKIVKTITQLRKIETEKLRRFSDNGFDHTTVSEIRRMLALPEDSPFPLTGAFSRTRWAERLMASSPTPVFNFNTPLVTALLEPEEFEALIRNKLFNIHTTINLQIFPDEMVFGNKLLWEIRKDLVFVPSAIMSAQKEPRKIPEATLPKKWDFGVAAGSSVILLEEEYSLDGSAKLIIQNESGWDLATLHLTGPVARLPPLEEIAGL